MRTLENITNAIDIVKMASAKYIKDNISKGLDIYLTKSTKYSDYKMTFGDYETSVDNYCNKKFNIEVIDQIHIKNVDPTQNKKWLLDQLKPLTVGYEKPEVTYIDKIFHTTHIWARKPQFIKVVKETNSFVTVVDLKTEHQWINVAMSLCSPSNIEDSGLYKLSKDKLKRWAEFKEPVLSDSGYSCWSDEDKRLWSEYKTNNK